MARKNTKPQIAFRVDPDFDKQIRKYAKDHERDLTWILTKVIQIGWPIFLDRQKAA